MNLGATGSRLGYGTAALGRSLTKSERVRLIESAFECGLTHFDTAPLYGGGAAEEALGSFLRQAHDGVTVATKVGITPPSMVGAVWSRLAKRPPPARGSQFEPHEVRASLEASLRRLRASRVDLLLLHEVKAADVDDPLLETLTDAIERGDVGHVGIATSAAESAAILARGSTFPAVVQLALSPEPPIVGDRGLVIHSVIVGGAGSPGDLLRSAAERHPAALLLFGSRNAAHIRETAAAFLG